jgi:hypothetical protein
MVIVVVMIVIVFVSDLLFSKAKHKTLRSNSIKIKELVLQGNRIKSRIKVWFRIIFQFLL